jgi:magnesium transporter
MSLRGIITLDDIIDIIDEETSEDIYRASGISLEEIDEKNLLTGPMMNAVKARMPWLAVTMVGQFFAASIIASFHHTVSTATIAISFMPLLSGLSGNMGTQSETITVRGLALNLVNTDNFTEKFSREMGVGMVTGSFFATGVGLLSFLQYQHLALSALLFCAIIILLLISAALGMLLPYGYQRFFKQDPAGVGGPMITTLLDIMTFSTYLFVITILLDRMI